MEEKEIFNNDISFSFKKRMRKNKMNWKFFLNIFVIFSFIFLLLMVLLIFSEHERMKNIKQNNYKEYNIIPFNISTNITMNFSDKEYVFNVIDMNNNISTTKNEIHVSYSLDSKIVYPTYISMVSGLENCDESNFLIYHLLLSHDFNTSNISFFETLKEEYEVKIYYYIIPNIFKSSPKWTSGTDCVYYKILLPFIFPNLDRMIYLDSDTLIRKDIFEMFNCSFNDNYILGFPFYMGYIMKRYGIIKPKHYINGGCLLFNLNKIRKDKKDIELLELTIKRKYFWGFLEQDSINYVFNPNIGFLPLKYGIYMIGNNRTFKILSEKYVYSKLNLTEGYEAVRDPSIVHFSCCWPKVWTNGTKNLFGDKKLCLRYQNEFYYYTNKTRFYNEIYNALYFKTLKPKKKKKKKTFL